MEKIKQKALTFDDVLLLPRYTDFLPVEADLATKISRNITLKIPKYPWENALFVKY